jgi:hypothetical protein
MKTAADKANAADRPRPALSLRQQHLAADAPQRSLAVPQSRRPGVGSTRGCIPTTTHRRIAPSGINYDKMEKIARMIHQMSWDLANANGRPKLAGRA